MMSVAIKGLSVSLHHRMLIAFAIMAGGLSATGIASAETVPAVPATSFTYGAPYESYPGGPALPPASSIGDAYSELVAYLKGPLQYPTDCTYPMNVYPPVDVSLGNTGPNGGIAVAQVLYVSAKNDCGGGNQIYATAYPGAPAHCPNGGTGGAFTPDQPEPNTTTCSRPDPPKNICPIGGAKCGDPIDAATGNVTDTVTDYHSGGPFPLTFSRTYNSLYTALTGRLGTNWNDSLETDHISISCGLTYTYTENNIPVTICDYWQATLSRSDGSELDFFLDNLDETYFAANYWGTGNVPTAPLAFFSTDTASDGEVLDASAGNSLVMTGQGYTFSDSHGNVEQFDTLGKLLSITKPGGLSQTYQYDANNRIQSVSDGFGRTLSVTYDSSGRIQTLTNPTNGVYTYSYDTSGNLISVQYPDSSAIQYLYGENGAPAHALTGVIDEDGNRFATWSYDSQGRGTASVNGASANPTAINYGSGSAQVTEGNGNVRTLTFQQNLGSQEMVGDSSPCVQCGDKQQSVTYDLYGYVSTSTDFDGNVTLYTHDAAGRELSRTEASGTADARTITTTWNTTFDQPASITEPGRTTAYTYDTAGHVLTKTVTDTATSVARTTTYTYYSTGVATGLLYTVTDPLNHVTTYGYDAQGDLSSTTNAMTPGQTTSIGGYDANGMPGTITDPNGVITTLTYDARQRLKSRTVAGAETDYSYDSAGLLTQVTLPTGSYLKYSYDTAHRLTGISDSVGDSIVYTLDSLGNRTAEQTYDPSSNLTRTLGRSYNSLNQLLTVVGGAGQTTTYTDDLLGNATSIKDPMNQATGQTFDALNRLSTVVDPESGNTTYNYDALDHVQDVTDPKGLNTHYVYDAFGDVTEQDSPDTGTTTYTYDLAGNRLTKTDARNVTATYNYDALNRLMGISYPDTSRDVTYTYDQGTYGIGHLTGIADASGTTAYSYDAHGNTIQKVVTLGGHVFTLSYQYDTADSLTGMTYPSGMQVNYTRDAAERVTAVTANGNNVVSGITYEPFGPVSGLTLGNSLTESRSYDLAYRLTGITTTGIQGLTLGYNADDDITSIIDGISSGNSQTLGYDSLNRLTAASGAYGSLGYSYDLDGNRTQETTGGTATSLTYDTVSNKLLTVGAQGDQYDAVGNLTSDGSHTYNYDVSDRLAGFDGDTLTYVYNGLGQRAVKFPVDNSTPSVNITAPASGPVSGIVTVTATAQDQFGIASVQFQLDGANLGSLETAAPYAVSWDTTTANQGPHTLTAVATDSNGRTGVSASVVVSIADTIPPTVAITAPANGASVSGTVTLTANAADNVGVTGVQFQLDGVNIGATLTAAPYNLSWDSTTASVGAHSLTAIASDGAGHQTTSTPVSITVLDAIPPTVSITAPVNGANLSNNASVNVTATAADNIGVTSVQFQLDGANLGTPITAAPYATTWSQPLPTGTHTLTAIATDAAGNATTSAAVSVTIAPTANAGSLSASPNVSTNGTLSAVGSSLTYAVVANPHHGSVSITNTSNGAFTYTPASDYTGSDSFTFQVTGSGVSSNTATESITVAGPTDDLSTYNFGFEARLVGTTSATKSITLTNNGSSRLNNISIVLGGTNPGQFTESDNCGTFLNAGPSSCTINITFVPTAAGAKSAKVTVTDSAADSPAVINFTGTALSALPSVSPTSLSFGTWIEGTTSTAKVSTLTNNGTGTLTINSITESGTAFGYTTTCGSTLASGASCNISVKFSPPGITAYTGTITITDNATSGSQTQTISLSGHGETNQ